MKIYQIAECPHDDTGDVLRFLIQSISCEEITTFNFLTSLYCYYQNKGQLTDRQNKVLEEIYHVFLESAFQQHPSFFQQSYHEDKDESEQKKPKKVKGFTVYDGGKK